MSTTYIAKLKNNDIKQAVTFCLDKIVNEKIKSTDTVLLKPNFLNDSPANTGVTTDLRVIRAIIELLKEKGIHNIILAESGFTNTEKIFRNLNLYDLENYGIKVINLEKSEKLTIDHPAAYILKKMVLPCPVVDADTIITIPKLKTHAQTRVTLGIKNFFGFLYQPQRKTAHTLDLDKSIIDIYTCLKNILNKKLISLIDAIYCLDGKLGPNIGTPVKMDLLISGDNLINVDTTSVRIMGCNPRSVRHLLICEQSGLGSLDETKTIGESIDNVKRDFTMPHSTVILYPHFSKTIRIIFKKQPIVRYPNRCTNCRICVQACPKDCIDITINHPIINYAECIGCLCCAEGCPVMVYTSKTRNALFFYALKKLYKLAGRIVKMLK